MQWTPFEWTDDERARVVSCIEDPEKDAGTADAS
jgi:hypothetical protein